MLCNCIKQMLESKNYVLVFGEQYCLLALFADLRARGEEAYLIFANGNAIVIAEKSVVKKVLGEEGDFDMVGMEHVNKEGDCEYLTYRIVQEEKKVLDEVMYSIFGTVCYI